MGSLTQVVGVQVCRWLWGTTKHCLVELNLRTSEPAIILSSECVPWELLHMCENVHKECSDKQCL